VLPRRPWNAPAFAVLVAGTLALGAMESAAIVGAVRPAPRTLRGTGVEARVPWSLVPGPGGRAVSVDGYVVAIRRTESSLEDGHRIRLGNRTWTEVDTDDPAGNPTVVLAAAEGESNLVVQAWCADPDCPTDKRDRIAEQIAASARAAR
jgi:hypothetical protein